VCVCGGGGGGGEGGAHSTSRQGCKERGMEGRIIIHLDAIQDKRTHTIVGHRELCQ
jgi:hypothetical protein